MNNIESILIAVSVWAIPVLTALTLHEVAHGRVAILFGDRTAQAQGRLSLNPLKHIDPIGTVLLPIGLFAAGSPFLFGWAKPVPIDARNFRHPRADMAWVALAGPASNLVMACLWTLIGRSGLSGLFGTGVAAAWLINNAKRGLIINVVLAVFNMLPVPPLDGGRVLVGILPPTPAHWLARLEPFGFWIVIALVYLESTHVISVLSPIVASLSNLIARLAS